MQLLEETVAAYVDDMKRKLQLGLAPQAEAMCRGIVIGLRRADEEKKVGRALECAPDFPGEHAGSVVAEFLREVPPEGRSEVRDRLLLALDEDVPDWSSFLRRTTEAALARRR
ncbi:MAG: hypothetical protein FJ109_08980 [Deltaproteobacteria bacterium]|nr:hypothetical protein [Deltaproteobacteria bacterium]